MNLFRFFSKRLINVILFISVVGILYEAFNCLYRFDHIILLLHPLVASFTIIVSALIFVQGTLSYKYENSTLQIMIGCVFLIVGLFEFLHFISFTDPQTPNKFINTNTNYWFSILSRLVGSIGLLIVFLFQNILNERKIERNSLFIIVTLFTLTSIAFIFSFSEFLPLLLTKNGLTSLGYKLISIIIFFQILNIGILTYHYYLSKNSDYILIIKGLLFVLLGGISGLFIEHAYEIEMLLGHLLDAVGYFFLLLGIYYPKFSHIYRERELVKEELAVVQKKLVRTRDAFRKKVSKVKENERKRLSQDVHDSIGQSLFAMSLELKVLKKNCTNDQAAEHISQLEMIVRNLIIEVKELAFRLRPSLVDEVGLIPALKSLIERINKQYYANINFYCNVSPTFSFNQKVENVIFRICQESMTNAIKYARAERIIVSLSVAEDRISVMIKDNGCGFTYQPENYEGKNLGLNGMRERTLSVNGTFSVDSEIGRGTTIQVYIPRV